MCIDGLNYSGNKMLFMFGRIAMTGKFEVDLDEEPNVIMTSQLLKLMSNE